jgi:secreted PhoX family phosphatase
LHHAKETSDMSRFFEPFSGIPNVSGNPAFSDLIADPARRTVLKSGALLGPLAALPSCALLPGAGAPLIGFTPIPASSDDAVRVPEGYKAEVVVAWGDPIGDARGMPAFQWNAGNSAEDQELQSGTHHDGMHFFPLPLGSNSSTHGLLVMNHEYPDNGALFPDGMANWSLAKVRKSQAALGCSVQEIRLVEWPLAAGEAVALSRAASTPTRRCASAARRPGTR